jgi:hypothetical protein
MSMPQPIREPEPSRERLRVALGRRRQRTADKRAANVALSVGHGALVTAVAAVSGIGFVPAASLVLTFVLATQGVVKLRRSIAARRAEQTPLNPFGH